MGMAVTYNSTRRKPLRSRADFLAAHGHRCYWCGELIVDDLWDDEHVMARELGGSDDLSNRRPIHRNPCHKIKTAGDRRLIAKGNRIRQKLSGLDPVRRKTPKRKIAPRPFPKGKTQWPSRKFETRRK